MAVQEERLSLQGRATAAAGAAFVAAAIVNPLDVIKTRIQAQAMASSSGNGSQLQTQLGCQMPGGYTYCSTLYEHPARRVLHPCQDQPHQLWQHQHHHQHQPHQHQPHQHCGLRYSQQHLLRYSHTLSPEAAASWASLLARSNLASNLVSGSTSSSLAAATFALTSAADSAAAGVAAAAGAQLRRWGITEGPIPVRRTPYALAGGSSPATSASGAASAVARSAAALFQASPTTAAAAAAAGSCECAAAANVAAASASASATLQLPAHSMWETAKVISSREGLPVLWRGTWASLLIAVPMVGIYMPLYDALLAHWSSNLGGAAPVAAGITARTAACFCVAPFELLRTRLQAAAGTGVSTRSMLHAFLHNTPQHSSSSNMHHHHQQQQQLQAAQQQVRPGVVLRAVPRMWTGFSATLVRDVPFSAMYWALVEPLRKAMLPRNSHWHPFQKHQQQQQLLPQTISSTSGSNTSRSTSSSSSSTSSSTSGAPGHHVHHTQLEILVANMVSGFIAGGVAAGATTPFDVVKTRMQISQPVSSSSSGSSSSSSSGSSSGGGSSRSAGAKVWRVLREVYHKEGVEGLFSGVKPRAYRAAPACAIVISVYELLKDWLTPAAEGEVVAAA